MPGGGVEPPRGVASADFESAASASSAIPARVAKSLFYSQVHHFFFVLRLGLEGPVADLVATTSREKLANLSTALWL